MFDNAFDRFFRPATPVGGAVEPASWSWMPAVDVYETDDHALVISAELPGVDRDAVSVTLENGVLTIAGERRADGEVEDGRVYRSERAYGAFRRSFTLPRRVDAAAVTAEHKNGTLQIRLPLREDAKPHQIDIKAA
tara:strand:+ start:933 stop:1340 length:408 start_codon:yes stop_codon:yes gene_type:complete